jgi:glycosyltransferase involved in cell wall biosynthesis
MIGRSLVDLSSRHLPADPLVSVWMVTYQHAEFIGQAIESVLAQETSFPFELVIGEDCSRDGTREIVRDWQRRFPHRIRVLMHRRNVGPAANGLSVLRACRGRYVAMLEGDDYWTDPAKLRLQVEMLEAWPDAILCGARAAVLEDDGRLESVLPPQAPAELATWGTRELFEGRWWFRTCTKMIPRRLMSMVPRRLGRDWGATMWLIGTSGFGRACFLDRTVAVYRQHPGGIWTAASDARRAASDARTLFHLVPHFRGSDRARLESLMRRAIATVLASGELSLRDRVQAAAWLVRRSPGDPSSWRQLGAAIGATSPLPGDGS